MLWTMNILICGDNNVGKTAYLTRLITGEFTKNYVPTVGENVSVFPVSTDDGDININCIDSSDVNSIKTFDQKMDAAIIMFDVTSQSSYDNVGKWYKLIIEKHGQIPIVLCGNKVDLKERVVRASKINFHRENNLIYFDLSAKSNYNFEKPFLIICRKLMNNWDLKFIEAPAIAPPTVMSQ